MSQDDQDRPDDTHDSGISVITEREVRVQRPSMYKVILHNDDYTPMDFVTDILERVFNKNHADATEIMLTIHYKGYAVCGLFPYEIAETKVAQVTEAARDQEYPLQCTLEKDA